jgi:hypothetical protein
VGNPAGNHLTWNGTSLTFSGALSAATGTFAGALSAATGTFAGSLSAATGTFAGALSAATGTFAGALSGASGSFATGNVTINTNGIAITPSDSSEFLANQAYRWTVSTGNMGLSGADGPSNGRLLIMQSKWTGTPARNTGVQVRADSTTKSAFMSVVANETVDSYLRLSATELRIDTTVSGTAGAINGYLNVIINGTPAKIALYAV